MKVNIIEDLCTTPVPRDTQAPWLDPRTNKVKLYQRFVIQVTSLKHDINDIIVIPEGYVSDWSTIPRPVWFIYPPNFSEARRGAVAHDYIYSHLYQFYSKEFADDLLIACMKECSASKFSQHVFSMAVRLGGKGGWHYRNKKGTDDHWRQQHEKLPYRREYSFLDETATGSD